jgi:hypothetical protein
MACLWLASCVSQPTPEPTIQPTIEPTPVVESDVGLARDTIVALSVDCLIAGDNAYVYGRGGEEGRIRDWLHGWAEEEGLPLQT